MIKEKNIKYLLIALLIISVSANLLAWGKIKNLDDSIKELRTENQTRGLELIENEITYTTFSSPKANFEFEYPDTWMYDEKTDPYNQDATNWGFYLRSKKKPRSLILAVTSPLSEIVDFCSGGPLTAKGWPYGFVLSVFPTNDPDTFITYEQCGDVRYKQNGEGYIYWQKGKYFANASKIKDIHNINLMLYYSNSSDFFADGNKESAEIAKHIAQSIKIK